MYDNPKCDTGNIQNAAKNCPSAVWTANSIFTLLKLYEHNLEILETPKKKTKIWTAISNSLKDYRIQMTPDQVRWKINALTKRYKQCVNSGQHKKFKYYLVLNNIYAKYIVSCDNYYTIPEMIHKNNQLDKNIITSQGCQIQPNSKTVLELRKNRLADKIESDRCQSKVQLEKQWLEYLKRQEEYYLLKDNISEKKLKLREEEFELRKRKLEVRETIELRSIHLKEKVLNEFIQLEREKCDILSKMTQITYEF